MDAATALLGVGPRGRHSLWTLLGVDTCGRHLNWALLGVEPRAANVGLPSFLVGLMKLFLLTYLKKALKGICTL